MGSKGKGKAQDGGRYRDLPDEEERVGDDPDETARWEQEEQQVYPLGSTGATYLLISYSGDGSPARRYFGHDIRDIINIGVSGRADRSRSGRAKRVRFAPSLRSDRVGGGFHCVLIG